METWVLQHWYEIAGSIFAIIYLYFSIREIIWLWPTGFLSSLFFMVVFFNGRLYADMGLQVYYLGVSIYGWYHWVGKNGPAVPETRLETSSLSISGWVPYSVGIVFLNIVLYFVLIWVPDKLGLPASDMPALDAFTTASSIIATWMLARKILENWIIWMVVDAVSLGMYLFKGMHVTALLFAIYTIMAVVGYLNWRKHMFTATNEHKES